MMPDEGDIAPDIEVVSQAGERHTLDAALQAGPVLLCFFKRECATCGLSFPVIERIWRHYRDHQSPEGMGLVVWGVSQDDVGETQAFVAEHELSFPVLLDGKALAASRAFAIESTPSLFLLAGREKLQFDSKDVDPEDARRVMAVMVEGWSRSDFSTINDEIAVRIGTLPAEPFEGLEVPETRPG